MLQINILLTSDDGCNKILVITIIQMETKQRIAPLAGGAINLKTIAPNEIFWQRLKTP